MGYGSRNNEHYWINDNLVYEKDVPQSHIDAFKEVGCNYFENFDEEGLANAVAEWKYKPKTDDQGIKKWKIHCKIHPGKGQ